MPATRPTLRLAVAACALAAASVHAQIADPADIEGPRAEDPTDAGRQTTVVDKYRLGQTTGGAADTRASGQVSSVGSSGSN